MRSSSPRRQLGLSLPGLAVALALAAVTAAATVPSFDRLARSWALARSAQGLLAGLHQARAAAWARGVPVVLCATDAPRHCGSTTLGGWQLFTERVAGSPVRLDAGDELLQSASFPASVEVRATRSAVTFWPSARSAATSSFIFCDRRGRAPARVLIISQTGRTRASARLADGTAPDCPHA